MSINTKLVQFILPFVIESALKNFDVSAIKKTLDSLIDRLEEHIENTETQIDDNFLPVIYFIRAAFDIPDLPDIKKVPLDLNA